MVHHKRAISDPLLGEEVAHINSTVTNTSTHEHAHAHARTHTRACTHTHTKHSRLDSSRSRSCRLGREGGRVHHHHVPTRRRRPVAVAFLIPRGCGGLHLRESGDIGLHERRRSVQAVRRGVLRRRANSAGGLVYLRAPRGVEVEGHVIWYVRRSTRSKPSSPTSHTYVYAAYSYNTLRIYTGYTFYAYMCVRCVRVRQYVCITS